MPLFFILEVKLNRMVSRMKRSSVSNAARGNSLTGPPDRVTKTQPEPSARNEEIEMTSSQVLGSSQWIHDASADSVFINRFIDRPSYIFITRLPKRK